MLNKYFYTKKLLSMFLIVVLILLMIVSVTFAGNMEGVPPKSISIFSGQSGGSWWVIGAVLSEIFMKSGVPSSVEIGGGTSNIVQVATRVGEIGMTNSIIPPVAFKGGEPFDQKYDNMAGLCYFGSNLVHIAVTKDSGIDNIADLKGKEFASQALGTSSQKAFEDTLKAYGLSEADLKISRGGQSEGAALMQDRHVIGMAFLGGYPSATLAELALLNPVNLLGVSDEAFGKLVEMNSGYVRETLPAGTYNGQDKEVISVGSDLILIIRKDMPDEEAYWIIKKIVENIEDLKASHGSMSGLTVEALSEVSGIEIHPGVKKFFDENKK